MKKLESSSDDGGDDDSSCEEESSDDDSSDEDSDDEEESQLISLAHYDVLAENITKLIASRPSWSQMEIGRQDLLNSTDFVDYDKIDLIEQDEEDS